MMANSNFLLAAVLLILASCSGKVQFVEKNVESSIPAPAGPPYPAPTPLPKYTGKTVCVQNYGLNGLEYHGNMPSKKNLFLIYYHFGRENAQWAALAYLPEMVAAWDKLIGQQLKSLTVDRVHEVMVTANIYSGQIQKEGEIAQYLRQESEKILEKSSLRNNLAPSELTAFGGLHRVLQDLVGSYAKIHVFFVNVALVPNAGLSLSSEERREQEKFLRTYLQSIQQQRISWHPVEFESGILGNGSFFPLRAMEQGIFRWGHGLIFGGNQASANARLLPKIAKEIDDTERSIFLPEFIGNGIQKVFLARRHGVYHQWEKVFPMKFIKTAQNSEPQTIEQLVLSAGQQVRIHPQLYKPCLLSFYFRDAESSDFCGVETLLPADSSELAWKQTLGYFATREDKFGLEFHYNCE